MTRRRRERVGGAAGGKDAQWAEAKRRCRLSAEEVRMAKELGIGPRSLIGNVPSPGQRWKAPVKVWVRELYAKRFGGRGGDRGGAGYQSDSAGTDP